MTTNDREACSKVSYTDLILSALPWPFRKELPLCACGLKHKVTFLDLIRSVLPVPFYKELPVKLSNENKPRLVRILRWIARIWSLMIVAFAVLMIVSPDPYSTEPVPLEDWFLLSLWGIAILGLLIAWRWELAGGAITIGFMLLRELAWIILKGPWLAGFLLIWLVILPPAVLFLVAGRASRNMKSDTS